MSDELKLMICLIGAFVLIALGGTLLIQEIRWRQKQDRARREKEAEAFVIVERLRLQVNTKRVMKEIDELLKKEHPQATRQERRAVKAAYQHSIISA